MLQNNEEHILQQKLFVGIDGGATKCTVRLEDEHGHLLGQAVGGPANIRLSVEDAWQSIKQTMTSLMDQLGISAESIDLHAGMGLAGCELADARVAFMSHPHEMAQLEVTSDAHAACLGAHGGQDGAVIIVGTGTVGFKTANGAPTKVGGWGFPHDDGGSGAWLGLHAMRITLQALDGRQPMSMLANAVYHHFDCQHEKMVAWANTANSTRFAELAPLVVATSAGNDPVSCNLLSQAAREIERIANALDLHGVPCVLLGGVAPHIEPYLSADLRKQLKPCKATPAEGAMLLLRKAYA